ncbi:DEAD/DEAH box helicase [Candidatus Dependentiae bacterium]|nr:DEAD/DEAH box helicase [Candidatus Dependentiae bacterium]MBU4387397.1 DEAD/DEAH box helicase [Candidatus Dependentiae bacterium]
MDKIKFENLGLSAELLKAVASMGFETATPIQAQAIPEILNGNDIVGQASTGTGKTAAFGLPAIEKIDANSRDVQVLVLCPTRELAIQVSTEINKFLKFKKNISSLPIYGGQPIERQFFGLRRGPQIVVGTPGRMVDHLKRGTLKLNKVKIVVLDEADEMLDMGFRDDIEFILNKINKDHQTVLFSATMSAEILQITKRYQKDPKLIKVKSEKANLAPIEQAYLNVESPYKIDFLMDLLNQHKPKLAIVFCNTRRYVDKISKILYQTGYKVAGIHGDIRQSSRDAIMGKFRKGVINILVATDVAARGIDVSDVEFVFNYDIPREIESYVHRIGRTGRAGKTGKAFSFVARSEMMQLRRIMQFTKIEIPRIELEVNKKPVIWSEEGVVAANEPSKKEFVVDYSIEKKADSVLKKVRQNIGKHDLSSYLNITESFVSDKFSSADLSAALLKMLIDAEKSRNFNQRYR